MKWAYGVTTVPERRAELLPKTLESLRGAGFESPRLFIDNCDFETALSYEKEFGLEVTCRGKRIRSYGNWILALWELYLRDTKADRYAIFQDDFVTYKNLREYLERTQYPPDGYLNLYTFPSNQALIEEQNGNQIGFHLADQCGKGAVGLVFSKEAALVLLEQNHMVRRPLDDKKGHKSIDGGVVTALRKIGWKEYVHNPSLLQHRGIKSSMGNKRQELAISFRGEDFDALDLLEERGYSNMFNLREISRPDPTGWSRPTNEQRRNKFLFDEALSLLEPNSTIFETGAVRDPRPIAKAADGHSTVVWAQSGHRVITCDIDKKAIETTKQLTGSPPNLQIHHTDGVGYLKRFREPIHLLYLDGPGLLEGGMEFSLNAYRLANMAPKSVVLVDDVDLSPSGGKAILIFKLLRRDGFKLVAYDRQALFVRGYDLETTEDTPSPPRIVPNAQVKPSLGRVPRIGLVGYNTNSGLGEFGRQTAVHADIDQWLIKPHASLKTNPVPGTVDGIVCRGNVTKMQHFVSSVDIVLSFETVFYRELPSIAKAMGRRLVMVPMLEWLPPKGKGWTDQIDLYICPTQVCYDTMKAEGYKNIEYFPWPTDIDRFPYFPRTKVSEFLYLNGKGGWQGRKGGDVIRRAKEMWPEFPVIVRSQSNEKWPEGTDLRTVGQDNRGLYQNGQVLIAPHTLDGYGLEPIEAMISGMPVITPDGLPWNENPAIARIPNTKTKKRVKRMMDWHDCDAKALVEICKALLGKDIEQESLSVRNWAMSRSWDNRAEEFNALVRSVI